MRMRSQNESAVEENVEEYCEYEELENEDRKGSEDMWSLITAEPRNEAFASLLAANCGQKDLKENATWDLTPAKPYVPSANGRSSLSNDSLQICTEGLGCESCDGSTDCASSESEDEEEEVCFSYVIEENLEKEERNFQAPVLQARSFPPPLPSLSASTASYMRSFKKDGRFVLQSVKAPSQNYLHSFREGGRLKMHLVSKTDDDNFAFLDASSFNNEIVQEAAAAAAAAKEEESESEEYCTNDTEVSALERCCDGLAVQESEPLPEAFFPASGGFETNNLSDAVSISCNEITKENAAVEFNVACNLPPKNCEAKDDESADARAEIPEGKSSPKASFLNVYSGWRTESPEQNSAIFCQNWQKAESLPNYPVNKHKYGEAANVNNVNLNVNESCVHPRVPIFWGNDMGSGRCHELKSLSVWRRSQCIATST